MDEIGDCKQERLDDYLADKIASLIKGRIESAYIPKSQEELDDWRRRRQNNPG